MGSAGRTTMPSRGLRHGQLASQAAIGLAPHCFEMEELIVVGVIGCQRGNGAEQDLVAMAARINGDFLS